MKCEIIKDLLPIYIEELCSSETKKEVEAHLESCPGCREEYRQLKQDYQAASSDEEKIEEFLEEKELLEKSREAIKLSVIDQIIGKFFSIIAVLGISINLIMVALTFIFYQYRYPKLYFKELGSGQVFILLLPFLPTVLALAGKSVMKRIKKQKTKKLISRVLFAGTIPAILMGGFYTLFFLIVPPLGSVTDNPSCYMEMDGELESFKNAAESFLPGRIPDQAVQVDYHYERYSALFSEKCTLEASWVLPEDAYKKEKDHMIQSRNFRDSAVSESGGSGMILNTIDPGRVIISFEFNDEARRVAYRVYEDKRY